jgi:hypothetical protein
MGEMAAKQDRASLREQVETLLPSWESWYPSLFDAACDLGLLRARVCSPSSLVLSVRHAGIHSEAVQAFREQWSAEEPEELPEEAAQNTPPPSPQAKRRRNRKRKRGR